VLDVTGNSGAPAPAVWSACPDGLLLFDADARVLDVNEAYCRLVGRTREEQIGRPFVDPYDAAEQPRMMERFHRVFHTNTRYIRERTTRRLANGGVLLAEITQTMVQTAGGPALLTFCRDVEAVARFERELEQRARQQQAVAELGQAAVSGLACNALLQEAVRRVAETLEVAHCSALELLPDGEWLVTRAAIGFDDEVVNQTRTSAHRTQSGYALECGLPCIVEDLGSDTRFADSHLLLAHGITNGVTVIIPGSPRPFGTLSAHITGRRSFNQDDIHFLQSVANLLAAAIERRRAEEKIENALAAAKEATQLKSRFLANMSHEIRTPMNGILGTAELLLSTVLEPEQREYAEIVRASTEALLTVINDILDLSRIEAGRIDLESVVFDPVDTLQSVLDLLSVRAQAKGLVLTRAVARDMPRSVRGDPGRLRQVLMNLLGNALKFTRAGVVETSMAVERPGGGPAQIRFCVRDTGIGIAPEDQARLFQSFTQVDNSDTRRHGGTGLGLAISKQLVELMGGAIGLESEPGIGSAFWFTMRLVEVASAAADAGRSKPVRLRQRAESLRPPGTWRILLAEDNPVNRKVASRILQQAGFAVDAVTNGREALEALEVRPYDVVLMDVQMPEMDGFQATRAIRSRADERRRTPVLAMTANVMSGDRELCLEAGMDDYISKPVRPDELRGAVLRWLGPETIEMPA